MLLKEVPEKTLKRSSRIASKKCMEMLSSIIKKSPQKIKAHPPSDVTKVFKNVSGKAFQQTSKVLGNKTYDGSSEESSKKASKRSSDSSRKASKSLKLSNQSRQKSLKSKSKAVVLASQSSNLHIIKTSKKPFLQTSEIIPTKTTDKKSEESLRKAYRSVKPSGESYRKSVESNSKAVSQKLSKICMICKRSFTSMKKLKDHNTKHHFLRHCPNCPKTFQQTKRFILHLRSHLLDHPYYCKICLEGFNGKKDLLHHKKEHTIPGRLSCDKCSEVFPHLSSLRRHGLIHDGPPYPCKECDAVFSTFSDASVHLTNHVNRCFLCPKEVIAFPTQKDLSSHMVNMHQNADKNEVKDKVKPCGTVNLEEDGDSDSMDDSLSSDEESDSEADNKYQREAVEPVYSLKRKDKFICFICYGLYPSCELLKSHMTAHNWYPCNSCPRFFSDVRAHAQHDCNFGVSPFRCEICNTELKCENCNLKNDISDVNMNALQSILELPRLPINYSNEAELKSLLNFLERVKYQKGPLDIQSFNHVGLHTLCLEMILKSPSVKCLFPSECIPYFEELHSKFEDLGRILCNRINR